MSQCKSKFNSVYKLFKSLSEATLLCILSDSTKDMKITICLENFVQDSNGMCFLMTETQQIKTTHPSIQE